MPPSCWDRPGPHLGRLRDNGRAPPTAWETEVPVNQLYHDRGVASLGAHHSARPMPRSCETADTRSQASLPAKPGDTRRLSAEGDHFEIFRQDQVQVTSTRLAGGDWCWRLSDRAGKTLVEGAGYRSEQACRVAVAFLRDRAFSAA